MEADFEIDESDVSDDDIVNESLHSTDTEQSDQEDDIPVQRTYLGKDQRTQWSDHPIRRGRTRRQPAHNLVRHLPGPVGEARFKMTPEETFNLFVSEVMLEDIVRFTNMESVQSKQTRERDANLTNLSEIKACLGLLFLGGILKSSHTNLEDLWSADGCGVEYFRLTMGINRFRFLLRVI